MSKERILGVVLAALLCSTAVFAQDVTLEVTPRSLELKVGERAQLETVVKDGSGLSVEATVVFFSQSPAAVSVTDSGLVRAHRSGRHTLVALVPAQPRGGLERAGDPGVRVEIPVTISPSELARLEIEVPERIYVGARVAVRTRATNVNNEEKDVRPALSVSDAEVASVIAYGPLFDGTFHAHPFYDRPRPDLYPGDAAGLLTALAPGTVTLRASTGELTAERTVEVDRNPVQSLSIRTSAETARTGDVVHFDAYGADSRGGRVDDPPVTFALESHPDPSRFDTVGAGAPAQILPDGRFVSEQAGVYTVLARSGKAVATKSILVTPRDVHQDIELVGQAPVRDRITSDLWVWEGLDGRDYAALGTWNADGHVLFFDVTDPANMRRISEVQVDARTVNDVKVSEDKRIAVITREGASNRRNGLVIIDVSDPRDPKILSRFDDQLTGGVHNVFIYQNHVYAINNGRRWDVINIEDPSKPFRVSRFEDEAPGRSVHDVWLRDGIAFQAGNTEGLIVVDVGGGGLGGSPASPVEMGRLYQLTGWNHAVWPFRSKSTGKFYIVTGDESHPVNPRAPGPIISWEERLPSRAMGWNHAVAFDDPEHPREVARYRVPEAGPHNLWIDWEKEIMYVAYFNGGLRVVDVSGELLGDLYRQGREIAKFYSDDSQGFVPNSPFVWGPQPHKGTIFFSDFHSGLWAVRLVRREESKESMP